MCLRVTEVDPPVSRRQLCGGIPAAVQKMLQFGRQLHSMGEQLKREFGTNNANKKALLVRVSTLVLAWFEWRLAIFKACVKTHLLRPSFLAT